jgi:putative ABC transport system permease protein
MSLLRRSSLRHLSRHRWQAALSILGVGLGVAVVLAVDLAVSSARVGFTLSAEAVAGRATHRAEGGPSGLDDDAYRRLRATPGVVAAAPVVEGAVVGDDGRTVLRVLGIDPFAEGPFRRYSGGEADRSAASLLIGARAALVTPSTAAAAGVNEEDWLGVEVAGRRDSVRVAALLEPADEASRLGLGGLLVMDVGTAQAVLDRAGLDRVDLILASEGAVPAVEAALRSGGAPGGAPGGVRGAGSSGVVVPAGAAAGALRDMTRAFDLNLRALSLLALVFGLFLIYNSVTFSVVQRRRLLGTLRALGASRRQVFRLVLGEAAVLGAAGTALGMALGILLAGGLLRLVTRTIEDLYFVVTVRELILTPTTLATAAVLGMAGTLLAAIPPAYEAATTHPRAALIRSELEVGVRRRLPRLSLAGLVLAALGMLVLLVSRSVDASFVGLFGVIIGMALLTPQATVLLMRLLRPVAGALLGVLGRMAASGVSASLSRTGPAITALTLAVAVTVGVAVMIGSFRGSLVVWLDSTLSADVYVSPLRGPGGEGGRIEPPTLALLAADPAVSELRRYRRVDVPSPDGAVDLMAIGVDSRLRDHFAILEGDIDHFWDDFVAGRVLLVSEPFAHHRGVGVGDAVRLGTDGGLDAIPVAGVFRDYGSDRGMAMISYTGYRQRFDDATITSVAMILDSGVDRTAVMARMGDATAPVQPLMIRSDHDVADLSLAVFDRTFAITQVLRLLALIVAFVGVLSALMALQLERARELGVLRANGLTPGQVWTMVASQTGLMGLAAGLMAVPLGLVLAVLMIEFVNRRSFGWTIDLAAPPGVLLQAVALAVTAALLAGLFPAWRMARTSPAEALRGE